MSTSDILNEVICEGAVYLPGGLKVTVNDAEKAEEVIAFLKELYKDAANSFCDKLFSHFDPEECEMISIPIAVCEPMDNNEAAKLHPFSEINIDGNVITLKFTDNVFEVYGGYDAIEYGNKVAKIMKKEMKLNGNISEFEGFIGWWQTGGPVDDFCFAEISSTTENSYARELVNY